MKPEMIPNNERPLLAPKYGETFQPLRIASDFTPTGDQPEAIRKLCEGLRDGVSDQTLLGVTAGRLRGHDGCDEHGRSRHA